MRYLVLLLLLAGCNGIPEPGDEVLAQAACVQHGGLKFWVPHIFSPEIDVRCNNGVKILGLDREPSRELPIFAPKKGKK